MRKWQRKGQASKQASQSTLVRQSLSDAQLIYASLFHCWFSSATRISHAPSGALVVTVVGVVVMVLVLVAVVVAGTEIIRSNLPKNSRYPLRMMTTTTQDAHVVLE